MIEPDAIATLVGLGKLWGAVSWFHPWVARGVVDWDAIMSMAIHRVLDEGASLADTVPGVLAALGDPATRVASSDDLGDVTPIAPAPLLAWRDDNARRVAVVSASELLQGAEADTSEAVVTELGNADGVVVDLRSCHFVQANEALRLLRRLIRDDLPTPASSTRQHVGWPAEAGGATSYRSASVVSDLGVLEGLGQGPLTDVALALVVGGPDDTTMAPAAGLAAAGRAHLIWCGPLDDDPHGALVHLAGGVQVAVRMAEVVMPDGSVGIDPDLVIDSAFDRAPAVDAARSLLFDPVVRASRPVPPPTARRGPTVGLADVEEFPLVAERVLAAWKWWHVIDKHFAYRDLTDEPWEATLAPALAEIVAAEGALEYHLAMARFVARTDDSHARMNSQTFVRWVGTRWPDVAVRLVEGRTVVTGVGDSAAGIDIGDVVLSVDGQPVEERRDALRPFTAASTPQAMDRRLDDRILSGPEGDATLDVEGPEGDRRPVVVPRTRATPPSRARTTPVWQVLPEGVGYIDLDRVGVRDLDEALAAVWEAPAIVFDMRGYPHGTAWALATRLASEHVVGALFSKPIVRSAECDGRTIESFAQRIPPPQPPSYTGRVAVLIDASAISQAEHTCLFIDAATGGRALRVGSPTNGANGDVTSVVLPGGITAFFTGHDVRWADGTQLQRVGVRPHVHVEQTIAGIRDGRDQVLEEGVRRVG